MSTLNGKTAIVTGANSGMGMATTAALADMGAVVIMLCRNEKRGKEALNKLLEKPDRKLELSEEECEVKLEALIREMKAEFGIR